MSGSIHPINIISTGLSPTLLSPAPAFAQPDETLLVLDGTTGLNMLNQVLICGRGCLTGWLAWLRFAAVLVVLQYTCLSMLNQVCNRRGGRELIAGGCMVRTHVRAC